METFEVFLKESRGEFRVNFRTEFLNEPLQEFLVKSLDKILIDFLEEHLVQSTDEIHEGILIEFLKKNPAALPEVILGDSIPYFRQVVYLSRVPFGNPCVHRGEPYKHTILRNVERAIKHQDIRSGYHQEFS